MLTQPLQIALAIIQHPTEKRYLIAQRPKGVHLSDLWEFPGGKCLPGELPSECAIRETLEETGLTVTALDSWPPISFQYPERAVMLHPFLCHTDSADARPLGNLRVIWVSPNELDQYPFPAANASLLARLQSSG
jgi:8-oxo-dGTP diphosphatase